MSNRMVYNPESGIYEQACEFPDMYNSNMMSRRDDEYSSNTCIGGNMAFSPGYQGYNTSLGRKENNAAVKLQKQDMSARQTLAQQERERYLEREANTTRLAKIAEQNYKKSAQCANLKTEIKVEKMLDKMRKK